MKFKDLIGKKLRGIMEIPNGKEDWNEDNYLYLFLEDKTLVLGADNQDYSWKSNWRIKKVYDEILPRDGEYKSIMETIEDIWTDGYDLNTDDLSADMDKWIKAVGEGDWNAKEGENYIFAKIKLKTKQIDLGTVYWDCHYPSTIWELI